MPIWHFYMLHILYHVNASHVMACRSFYRIWRHLES